MTRARFTKENRLFRKMKKKKRHANPYLRERRCIYCGTFLPPEKKGRWCLKCVQKIDGNVAFKAIVKLSGRMDVMK